MISLSSANDQPLDQAAALKAIDAARADPKHSLWDMPPEARDRLYHQAYPTPSEASPPAAPSASPTPAASLGAPLTPEQAKQRVAEWTADPTSAYRRSFPEAVAEVERLLRIVAGESPAEPAPESPVQAPVSVADADLPPIRLPEGVSPETPVVHAARTAAFYAETPPAVLQRAADAIRAALEREEPSQEALDVEGDRMTAQAQAYYGANYPRWQAALEQGWTIAEADPALRDLLDDPRVWNLPAVAEFLVSLGRDPRHYYTRRFGTKRVA